MQRRSFLKTTALSVFGAALPLASTRAENRFKKYHGQTVVMSVPAHPQYDAMQKLLPAFTRATGIKVELDRLQILRMRDKQLLEMAKPKGDYDLICYIASWKTEYADKKLIRPLQTYLTDGSLADPDFDLADIVPAYLATVGLVGGPKGYLPGPGAQIYGLPYGAETSILAYRRDIFEKMNLTPPEDYGALAAMLPRFRNEAGIGGLTSRGQAGHQCVHSWLLHLAPLGGAVFDDQWHPVFDAAPGIQALEFLQTAAATGPSGISAFGQGEMLNAFLFGEAAMYLDSTLIMGVAEDPKRSRIAGKVAYALHPAGTHQASQSGGLGLAIPNNAAHPEAAFLLLQWLTSKPQDQMVASLGGSPGRLSSFEDQALVRQYPGYPVMREQLNHIATDWRPMIREWDQITANYLGVNISRALTGAMDAKQALQQCLAPVEKIMRQAGYLAT